MKLKTRFKIAMLIMLLIVVVLNTSIILLYITESLKENSEQYMQSLNEQKKITAENLMDTFVTMTQKPLIDDTMLSILKKEYHEYPEKSRRFYMYQDIDIMNERLYTEMFYKNEYIYAVTLFKENDGGIYSKQRSGKGILDISLKECEWYQTLIQTDGKEAVLFPYMKEDLYRGEEPIIAVGRLLKDPMTNHPIGIIRVDIAVKDLEKVWESCAYGDSEKMLFRDDEGRLLYTDLHVENWEKEYEESLKNDFSVTTYSERYGISITSFLPWNIVYEKIYNTIFIIMAITLGCIMAAFLLVEFIIKTSMKPIGELNMLMKEVRAGNLKVRAKVQSVGEFEEVCESFNLMVENTEHLIERVRQEENEKMEAEYKALQAQISPHFILNTINTIKWMAVIQGNKSIEKSLDSFSRLLSFVVREREEKILIKTELEQMEYYIDILSLRYYNKFQIDFQVDNEVKNCKTIKFLLQTLVENSVFHGFDEKKEKGMIQVRLLREKERIVYEVEDNGKGIEKSKIEEILNPAMEDRREGTKIGIHNINQRIKLIFGKQYGVSIRSEVGEYTIVRVEIPAQEE